MRMIYYVLVFSKLRDKQNEASMAASGQAMGRLGGGSVRSVS